MSDSTNRTYEDEIIPKPVLPKSDTPRTDAELVRWDHCPTLKVMIELARQLERELSTEKTQWRHALALWENRSSELTSRIVAMTKERDQWREVAEGLDYWLRASDDQEGWKERFRKLKEASK